MKKVFLTLSVFTSLIALGQRAELKDNILTYKDRTIAVGDTVNVSYGSGSDGKFVFVKMGSVMTGVTPLESNFSKSSVKVDKIYKSDGRILVRGKVLNSSVNMLGSNKVFIEIEGAVDKKEVD